MFTKSLSVFYDNPNYKCASFEFTNFVLYPCSMNVLVPCACTLDCVHWPVCKLLTWYYAREGPCENNCWYSVIFTFRNFHVIWDYTKLCLIVFNKCLFKAHFIGVITCSIDLHSDISPFLHIIFICNYIIRSW